MKKLAQVLALSAVLFGVNTLFAEEVELKGVTGTCAKCDLKTASSCQNVAVVDGQTIVLAGEISKDFHSNLCRGAQKINVKGNKSEDGKTIEVTAIELAKESNEVDLKGVTATCLKCDLGKSSACQNVALIDGKEVELTGAVSKKFHSNLCREAKKVNVKGVKSDDGKSIEVTEIALAE